MTSTQTDTEPSTDTTAEQSATAAAFEVVALERIDAHPDNPRKRLGDLTELTRSIKAHGVLQAPTVMATDDGRYLAVAGHRRIAAAGEAGLDAVQVIVKTFTPAEAVEVMMVENIERADLTTREEIEGITRLMQLDTGYSARKLCGRLGKSQRWVKDRLTVAVLPTEALDLIDAGDLTLTAACAIAALADLGPEAITEALGMVTDVGFRRDGDRAAQVVRQRHERDAQRQALVAKLTAAGVTHGIGRDAFAGGKDLRELGLTPDQAKGHVKEPCHAVCIVDRYDGPAMVPMCTDPKRHRQSGDKPADSTIVATPTVRRSSDDDTKQRRAGRVERMAAGTELFARTRNAPKRAAMTDLALWALIDSTHGQVGDRARTLLGLADNADMAELAAESPADLARVAAACACARGEDGAYHYRGGTPGRWMRFLIDHGWEPDPWTAERLD